MCVFLATRVLTDQDHEMTSGGVVGGKAGSKALRLPFQPESYCFLEGGAERCCAPIGIPEQAAWADRCLDDPMQVS